jgi:hypothetical protein
MPPPEPPEPRGPRRELPIWLWLFLPFAILVVQVVARAGGEARYQSWMRGEISVPEIGTVVVALVAFATGLALLVRGPRPADPRAKAWLVLFTLGCLFFAGEEASWGQHYVGWASPEFFEEHNEQKETGFHNMSAVLDQAPRAALTVGAILAVLIPWLARAKPERLGRDSRLAWLWPTRECVPAAALALLVRPFEKATHAAGGAVAEAFDMQAGEFKEYFIGYLLMIYALSLALRLRSDGSPPRRAA